MIIVRLMMTVMTPKAKVIIVIIVVAVGRMVIVVLGLAVGGLLEGMVRMLVTASEWLMMVQLPCELTTRTPRRYVIGM